MREVNPDCAHVISRGFRRDQQGGISRTAYQVFPLTWSRSRSAKPMLIASSREPSVRTATPFSGVTGVFAEIRRAELQSRHNNISPNTFSTVAPLATDTAVSLVRFRRASRSPASKWAAYSIAASSNVTRLDVPVVRPNQAPDENPTTPVAHERTKSNISSPTRIRTTNLETIRIRT